MTRPRSGITEKILAESNSILEAEAPMTLRHLFYILVSRGFIQNTLKDYRNLSRIISSARKEGRMEISAIVDNSRYDTKVNTWADMGEFLKDSIHFYNKDYWHKAKQTVEVWTEKDAIAGVLESVTDEYHVRLRVVRGYPSVGFLNKAIEQLNPFKNGLHEKQNLWVPLPLTVYYIGDHDPSGHDIERACREGMEDLIAANFGCLDEDMNWKRLAINPTDFKEFDIIPLIPKTSDPR